MTLLSISSLRLILLVSVFIAVVDNQIFFLKVSERLDLYSLQGIGFVATVFFLIITVLAFIQLLLGFKYFLKIVMIFLLMLSAVLSYFSQELGIIFDVDMIRNIVETIKDNNQQEAFELLSAPLLRHIFVYGVLPSIFIVLTKITFKPFLKESFWRLMSFVALLSVITVLFFANFKYTTYFARENRDLRVYVIPLYAFDSMKGYIRRELKKNSEPLKIIGKDAVQTKRSKTKTIGVMIVGETARWDHFSLNGYKRETNPKLQQQSIFNYSQTRSCGTSTAFSVPCMFSFLERENYSPEKAAGQTNSLDVLKKAGVNVYWVDNNSSCKGVCDRIGEINIRDEPDKQSPFFQDGEVLDETLIGKVDEILSTNQGNADILLVVHTMGSHGPKYYRRYPDEFSKFEPACKKSTPQECTDEEIVNAYDNTILYTDYIINLFIEYLKNKQKKNNTFLFYASDHGESLGEKGLYLHGLPYFLAPLSQTQVPMLSWFSKNYIKDEELDISAMQRMQDDKLSHDYLSYSLLGAFNINTKINKPSLSLIKRK